MLRNTDAAAREFYIVFFLEGSITAGMSVKTYLFNLVFRGVSMPGMGGQYAPEYPAVSKEQAEVELDNLELNWGEQYPLVVKSWRDNWHKLSAYFQYTDAIRRLIYTTNTVEGYHRQIRKVTKNKGVFTNDTALEKLVYLAYRNIRKKWTMPLKDWGQTAQQLAILFPERFKLFD